MHCRMHTFLLKFTSATVFLFSQSHCSAVLHCVKGILFVLNKPNLYFMDMYIISVKEAK